MDDEDDAFAQREEGDITHGSLLFVLLLALALIATGLLVWTDAARWLRLGVLAALWAALVGAFIAVKYRKQAAERDAEIADLHSVYELELEREVAARREHELEFETELRSRVEESTVDQLAVLRDEVSGLRENLEALLGGAVLVERVALHAESTRMRAIPDGTRQQVAVADERLRGMQAGAQVERTRYQQPVAPDRRNGNGPREAISPDPRRAGQRSRNDVVPVREPVRSSAQASQLPQQAATAAASTTVFDEVLAPRALDPEWGASSHDRQQEPASRHVPPPAHQSPVKSESQVTPEIHQREPMPQEPAEGRPDHRPPWARPAQAADAASNGHSRHGTATASGSPPAVNGVAGGRRRLEEPVAAGLANWTPGPDMPSGGWSQQAPHGPAGNAHNGPAANGSPPTNGKHGPAGNGNQLLTPSGSHSRADPPEEMASGSHAAGTSVTELLAAHGGGEAPRRRRRRAD
ncbi:MAG: DUF6779 domain-containing protein [Sciscionella sp.]